MRRRRDGFLLAEALVTLALSAIVLAGLASLIGLLLRAGDRAAVAAETQEASSRLVATLQRDISAAVPVRWAGDDAAFVFDGRPDRLVFAVADPAVRAVALEAEPVDGGTRLLRAEFPLPPAAQALGDVRVPDAVEMFRGAAIAFQYAGRMAPGGPEVVLPAWPSGTSHPDAVLVDIGGTALRIGFAVTAELGCGGKGGTCSLRPQDDEAEPTDAEDTADDEP